MNIVHASRGPYRTTSGSVTTQAEDGSTVVTPVEVQVADYRIVVCHDAKCPGPDKAGHQPDPLPGKEGTDRSRHHDFRFLADVRTADEIKAEVAAMEQAEAADTGPVAI